MEKTITEHRIKTEEKGGLIYQRFTPLESSGFFKHGFILRYKDERKVNSGDIPRLISTLTEIPEEKFKIVLPRQVHQSGVEIFNEKFKEKIKNPECDGLLTDQENFFLVVQVADCLPVFLFDSRTKVLGLAHIGWRGAVSGIMENFIREAVEFSESAPQELNLVLGPSIGKCCYKTSDSLAVLIDDKYIEVRGNERYLDLRSLVRDRFVKSGIREENIFVPDGCTCCGDRLYQSYRRDGERAGRMVAFIGK
jgi:hypothetical protein